MRQREERLVITFRTTAEAMAAEQAFRGDGIPGRLVPVPRQITAGCGLAWSSPLEAKNVIEQYMEEHRLAWEERGIYRI